MAFDLTQWSYIGFKGGSEPGVLSLSWLLQRADGRWFSIVAIANDSMRPIDENALRLSRTRPVERILRSSAVGDRPERRPERHRSCWTAERSVAAHELCELAPNFGQIERLLQATLGHVLHEGLDRRRERTTGEEEHAPSEIWPPSLELLV